MDPSRRKGSKGVAAIDDAEIKGYLNTKKEMVYKNIIWEILNKKHLQSKIQNQKQKLPIKKKKTENDVAAKRKKKIDDEIESKRKKKKQMLSLKVNFDVLDKQEDDGDEGGKEDKSEKDNANANGESEEIYDDEEEVDYRYVNDYYGIEEDAEEGYNFDEDY